MEKERRGKEKIRIHEGKWEQKNVKERREKQCSRWGKEQIGEERSL
jgi:hypothetical protein